MKCMMCGKMQTGTVLGIGDKRTLENIDFCRCFNNETYVQEVRPDALEDEDVSVDIICMVCGHKYRTVTVNTGILRDDRMVVRVPIHICIKKRKEEWTRDAR